jgi:hypothetical protein
LPTCPHYPTCDRQTSLPSVRANSSMTRTSSLLAVRVVAPVDDGPTTKASVLSRLDPAPSQRFDIVTDSNARLFWRWWVELGGLSQCAAARISAKRCRCAPSTNVAKTRSLIPPAENLTILKSRFKARFYACIAIVLSMCQIHSTRKRHDSALMRHRLVVP